MFSKGNQAMATGMWQQIAQLTMGFEVNSIAMHPDGSRLAAGGFTHPGIAFCDVGAGKVSREQSLTVPRVGYGAIAWSPVTPGGLDYVAALETSGTALRVFNGKSFDLAHQLEFGDLGAAEVVAFNADGSRLVAACSQLIGAYRPETAIYDTATWRPVSFDSGLNAAHGGWFQGSALVLGYERRRDGATHLLSVDANDPAVRRDLLVAGDGRTQHKLAVHATAGLAAVATHHGSETTICLVDLAQQRITQTFAIPRYICRSVCFVPSLGCLLLLLTNAEQRTAKLLDYTTGSFFDIEGADGVSGIGATADGRRFAVASERSLRVFAV
ncbi:WD40 repeat domain-containing protein [Tahibacter amnicola]|uniref:WD40 repeat domain-containing protein n=1 Tax=Tahibacter amnicola TaxID=2976241 RepID=A0ABY6BH36_9GAMM|nr:WD40 repeat domain-containing protein [Tahibacter amnicola]UXI69179.1 WD40 repeat domain-containing protein [Tahibacter amnicola]